MRTTTDPIERRFGVVVVDIEKNLRGCLPLRKGLTLADSIAQIVGIIEAAKKNGFPTYIFRDGEYEVDPAIITAAAASHVFRKVHNSPFGELMTDEVTLFDLLRADRVTDPILVGASARYCVKAGAVDAGALGFNPHTSPDTLLASEVDIELRHRELLEFYSTQTVFHASARSLVSCMSGLILPNPVVLSPYQLHSLSAFP